MQFVNFETSVRSTNQWKAGIGTGAGGVGRAGSKLPQLHLPTANTNLGRVCARSTCTGGAYLWIYSEKKLPKI